MRFRDFPSWHLFSAAPPFAGGAPLKAARKGAAVLGNIIARNKKFSAPAGGTADSAERGAGVGIDNIKEGFKMGLKRQKAKK